MRQHDQEFLAAISTNDFGGTSQLAEFACQASQHFIADLVSMRVIDSFEVIDIDHQNRQQRSVMIREAHRLLQLGQNLSPIGQGRQRIDR
jgi:hypothetical protein